MSVGSVWLRLENSACRFQQGRMPLSMLKAAQRKMSSCPVTVAARWRELLTLLLLVPATALAQSNSRELVSKMVAKELEAQKQPRYWMYLDSKKSPAGGDESRPNAPVLAHMAVINQRASTDGGRTRTCPRTNRAPGKRFPCQKEKQG
jgi:hypothetical protein